MIWRVGHLDRILWKVRMKILVIKITFLWREKRESCWHNYYIELNYIVMCLISSHVSLTTHNNSKRSISKQYMLDYITRCIKMPVLMPAIQSPLLVSSNSILRTCSLPVPTHAVPAPSASSPSPLVLTGRLQDALSVSHICVEQSDHFMVFAIQYSGQKERGFLCPACFKAPSGSSFPIDWDVPESLRTGFALGAGSAGYSPV